MDICPIFSGIRFEDLIFRMKFPRHKGTRIYILSHTLDSGIQSEEVMDSRRIRIPPGSRDTISKATGLDDCIDDAQEVSLKLVPRLHGWQRVVDGLKVRGQPKHL